MSISTNPMTIFRILTAMALFGVTFFCCAAESDIPAGYVKIGPEHVIPWRISETLTVDVKDSDDKPIAGAALELVVGKADSKNHEPLKTVSDAKGGAAFDLKSLQGARPTFVLLKIEAKDHVPLSAYWQTERSVDKTETVIPEKLTASMLRTEMIEGVVVDEDGKPIKGAEVEIGLPHVQRGVFQKSWFGELKRTTDAEGRWQYDGAPAGVKESDVCLTVQHPEFMPVHDWTGNDEKRSSYRRKTMVRGKSLSGRVVDEQGNPVAGAKVAGHTEDRNDFGFSGWSVATETDEDGKFRLAGLGAKTNAVDMEATGKVAKRIDPSASMTEKHISLEDTVLETAYTVKFRFVDEKGKPIPGVQFSSTSGFGARFYTSDAEGRMEVGGVPQAGQPFHFWGPRHKVGRGAEAKFFAYQPVDAEEKNGEKIFLPGDEEHVVTLLLTELKTDPEQVLLRWGRTDEWELPEKIVLRVVDRQGKALPATEVRILVAADSLSAVAAHKRQIRLATGKTDGKGGLVVDFGDCDPETASSLQILVSKPGFVRKEKMWYSDSLRGDVRRGGAIPGAMTVSLDKTEPTGGGPPEKVSGKVVQWSGKPISGVTVTYFFSKRRDDGEDEEKDGWERPVMRGSTVTDKDGRWTVDVKIPEDCDDVHLYFEHSEYKPVNCSRETLRREYGHTVLWKE